VSYTPRYDKGDWIADCDVCGRKYKASQLQKRWDGLMCCRHDWEIRQPQDFVRGVADTQIAPWTRPEPADQFIPINYWMTMSAIPVNCTATQSHIPPKYKQVGVVTEATTITITYFVRPAVTAGARQVNGSSINTNSIN
jgi:hypothetical protein